jgi:acetyl-CoA acetyltransferase
MGCVTCKQPPLQRSWVNRPVEDVDCYEANEAFAAVALVVQSELGTDPARFKPDGAAIAHGHPIGATGAILITKAVVSLCIGGGQGDSHLSRKDLKGELQ